MGKMTQNGAHIGSALALTAGLALMVANPCESAEHPRLVSVDAAKCSMCHAKLLRGAEVVHPPVEDDCTSCHDVTVGEDGTTVELSASEPDLCVMCHDGLESAAAGELASPHAPVMDSCLNCHTPHAGENERLLILPRTELCAGCHDIEELGETHGGQIIETVDCTSCHAAHGSANQHMIAATNQHAPFAEASCEACHREPFAGRIRLRARGEKVCTACHGDFREEAGDGGSVHPALEGTRTRAGCLSCHDPHMSPNSNLLIAEGSSLCGQCHDSVVRAANAETGHAAAAEDCATCHQPHVSTNRHLLTETTPDLCLMCHDAEDTDLIAAHLGAPVGNLDCLGCHSPHGAGNPNLLAANMHAVIADGCDTCHEGSYDQLMAGGDSDLCLACHDDIGEAAANAPVPHPAMEMARCSDCHNPHASAQENLINAPAGGECTTCHEDQGAGPGEVAHGIISIIGCRACHEPHGSDNPKLLRLPAPDLCLACHAPPAPSPATDPTKAVFLGRFEVPASVFQAAHSLRLTEDGEHGHPVGDHRTQGTPTEDELKRIDVTYSGELTCLTCHDPHKGLSKGLFKFGARSPFEACAACHPK